MEGNLTRGVSAIILAAGANTRLNGLVPPFMKPLILVNGRPLIQHALLHAMRDWKADPVIIVASPENEKMIKSVVHHLYDEVTWVKQEKPSGVLNAISLAMPLVTTEMTVILCGDNTFDLDELDSHILERRVRSHRSAIAIRQLDLTSAGRFTRVDMTYEPIRLVPAGSEVASGQCWIGPVLLETEEAIQALDQQPVNVEDFIMKAAAKGMDKLRMKCSDHGVPDELP